MPSHDHSRCYALAYAALALVAGFVFWFVLGGIA
jgi:hypothetical protein